MQSNPIRITSKTTIEIRILTENGLAVEWVFYEFPTNIQSNSN